MSFTKPICCILAIMHLVTITGCTKTISRWDWVKEPQKKTKKIPYEVTESVPYEITERVPYETTESVPYESTKRVRKYKTVPPVFPLPANRQMLLAVIPFTSSTGMESDGLEIAEEIEYEMQIHPKADEKYKILNRTLLSAIFTERELAGLNEPSSESILETKKILKVEGLITGHLRNKSRDNLSFIIKAISTEDATTSFTRRFEGSYKQVISDVVNVFYENEVPDGYRDKPITKYKDKTVTKYRDEKVTKYRDKKVTKYREEKVTEYVKVKKKVSYEVTDWETTLGIIALGIICLVALGNGDSSTKNK